METQLHAGVATADITPQRGDPEFSLQDGRGSRLLAKALVLGCGGERAALLCCDLIVLGEETVERIRALVSERVGLPPAHVMIACSHTHSGPMTTRWLTPALDEAYLQWVAERAAEAAAAAWEARRPAEVGVGRALTNLAVNRWVETPAGAHWGVAWDAPTDNAVTVLAFASPEAVPLAAVANFAAHPTVMSLKQTRRYGADFPGFTREYLQAHYPGLQALFTNAASGDLKIAFVDEEGRQFRYGDLEDARRYGLLLGRAAADALRRARPAPVGDLQVASAWCDLPLAPHPSREELEAEIHQPHYPQCGTAWGPAMLAALEAGALPHSQRAEVQVLRLGQAATILALPVELFVEVGLRLKLELAPRCPGLCLVGYANSYVGYLPARRSVLLDGESPRYDYCKFTGLPSVYAAEAEEVLVQACHEAVARVGATAGVPPLRGSGGRPWG